MLGYWRSHKEYREFVISNLESYSHDMSPVVEYLDIITKLYILDLDPLKSVIVNRYSNTGRKAVSQPEIIRIFIMMMHLKIPPNKWIDKLKNNHVLRTACGLHKCQIPSIASLYNFMQRITGKSCVPQTRTFRRKPSKKLSKGEKLPPRHPNITAKLKDKIITGRRFNDPLAVAINDILAIVIRQSYNLGLVNPNINVSGDGTCIPTGASSYGKRTCGCKSNGVFDCSCPRRFSDPSATWGWDSHEEHYFYGYTGYFISAYSKTHQTDLPLYLRIVDAKRHDSVSALVALSEFRDRYPQLCIDTFISDSASDNQPTYELLDFWNIDAVIALGKTKNGNFKYPGPLKIEANGTPICPAGHKMVYWGFYGDRHPRIKWRCPRVCGKTEPGFECLSCSTSAYGRTFYTKPEWDLRIFCKIPRGSEQWKSLMNERTAAERVNDRILNDYGIGISGRRGKKRIAFFTLIAAINIHLDAQAKIQSADWYARQANTA